MLSSNQIRERAQNIALVVFDVDGVLTDGTLTYGANGEELKHFNVKDGVGIKLLQTYGVEVAIISAKDSAPLSRRAQDLGVKHFFPGSKDKMKVLLALLDELKLKLNQVAYVGDDVIDLKVMQNIHLSITPADGYQMVKQYADVVAHSSGGKGVAREVADLILESRMDLEAAYIKAMLPEFEEQDFKQKLEQ